jgi:phosphatidylserine/phosphatidylglycerophosphate/cardiolipin synthase-like enzyme
VRTVPAGFYPFAPLGIHGIRHALLAAIRGARRFVYLENQYLWAPEIVEALIEAMDRSRSGPFRIVVVLPARAEDGKYDNDEHVRALREADGDRGIFSAYSPYAAGAAFGSTGFRYLPTYVHAKVALVDDEWLCVGSANLNRRGLATDTEMNVQAVAPDVARALRVSLWAEHLGMGEDAVAALDPIELTDTHWRRAADDMARCLCEQALPPPGRVLAYTPGRNPGGRLLEVMQALTLER